MGQRNTQHHHHQMRELQLDQGLSASGNTAEPVFLCVDYPDRGTLYGSQYNFQNFLAVPNFRLSAAQPDFHNPCVFPSSSNRNFLAPQYNASSFHFPSASINELGRSSESVDNIIGFGKGKNVQLPSGNHPIVNWSANSDLSMSFSFGPGVNPANSANYEHSDLQESGNVLTLEGSHRSVRSVSGVVSNQPESAFYSHPQPNYVLQATRMGHSLHPATNVWMPQFGAENNISGEACSNWNFNHPSTYMHGRYLQSGAFELTNMGVPAFPDASSSANATVLFNPAPVPNFHQHPLPVQAMQLQSYGHPVQIQAPYPHPLNNVHPINGNTSICVLNSGSRFLQFPSNTERMYRLRQMHHAAPDFGHGGVRILSPEDAAVIDRFYGAGHAIDQHQDMRMDTDGMSYEELLALGEQIGFVKTGLTEGYIVNHLKTSVHNSQTRSRLSQETDTCIICQGDYNEDEIVGTLDCGHSYHGECIKRWLVEKNLCPICKKTAFETDVRGG